MNTLEMLWRAHPLEVIVYGAITCFCGIGLAVCLFALIAAEKEVDEFVDAD